MVQLNDSSSTTYDELIYDAGLPIERDTVTVSITAGTAGTIAKGQVIDVAFDAETDAATYSVHAADGAVHSIVAETEPYDAAADSVVVQVYTSGNIRASKVVTTVELTDKDIDAFRTRGIVLK
jgi:hypothetical protein